MTLKLSKNFFWFFLLTLPIAILVGMRGATPDTQTYYDIFRKINGFALFDPLRFYSEASVEIGFGWYAYLISIFSSDSFVLFSLFSLLNFAFIYKSSQVINVKYNLVFLIYASSSYFFMQQFMQMRQGLAISVVMYAVVNYIHKHHLPSLIFYFLVALIFHQSVLLFLVFSVFFFLLNSFYLARGRFFSLWCICLILCFSLFFKYYLLDFLVGFSVRLQSYAASEKFSESVGLLSLPVVRTVFILIFSMVFAPKVLWGNSFFRFLFFLQSVAISVRLGFVDFAILSGRLSTAFSYAEVFLLPIVIMSRFSPRICVFICFVIFIIQLIVSLGFQAPYLIDLYFTPLNV